MVSQLVRGHVGFFLEFGDALFASPKFVDCCITHAVKAGDFPVVVGERVLVIISLVVVMVGYSSSTVCLHIIESLIKSVLLGFELSNLSVLLIKYCFWDIDAFGEPIGGVGDLLTHWDHPREKVTATSIRSVTLIHLSM